METMSTSDSQIRFHTVKETWDENADGLYMRTDQYIPQSHLDNLKEAYEASRTEKAGEYHQIASIPMGLVEMWRRQGFDIFDDNVKIKDVVKRLAAEDLTAFITSAKSI